MTEPIANAEQIAHWNDASGRAWAELSDVLDRQIESFSRRAMDALAPRRGDWILDVGCGCGRTTLALAREVTEEGRVVGVDISRPMLEIARGRAAAAGHAHARFLEADAQTHPLEGGAFDGLYSSFGVMFFADPVEAFRNLRRALKPGGRVAFLAWRSAAENPVMTTPMAAAKHRFPPQPPPVPGAPGPFAFADGARTRGVLEQAGFADVILTPHDAEMGGNTVEDSIRLALRVGPLAALLRANPDLVPLVREDVRAAFVPLVRDGLVWQPSATWIVTARNAAAG